MTEADSNKAAKYGDILARLQAEAERIPQGNTGALKHALGIADRQARQLSELLTVPHEQIEARLVELIPEFVISYQKDMPYRGTSFRGDDGDWNIHVRSTDRDAVRVFTVLRELKFIIDRPDIPLFVEAGRRGTFAVLADYFAEQVLVYRTMRIEP